MFFIWLLLLAIGLVLLVFLIVSIYQGIRAKTGYPYSEEEDIKMEWYQKIIVLIISALLIAPFILTNASFHSPKEIVLRNSFEIYALKDSYSSIQGSVFCFGTEEYNRYLIAYKNGKKQDKVSVDMSYVTEDDNQKPHINVFVEVRKIKSPILQWFYDRSKDTDDDLDWEYEIVVPVGTLVTGFEVDLEG